MTLDNGKEPHLPACVRPAAQALFGVLIYAKVLLHDALWTSLTSNIESNINHSHSNSPLEPKRFFYVILYLQT